MEPNTSNATARKQRTPEEIIKLLEDYEKSEGISVREYCDMIGISDATFYNWQKKYGEPAGPETDFIPLELTEPVNALQAEIKVIKFYGTLSVEQFKALLS